MPPTAPADFRPLGLDEVQFRGVPETAAGELHTARSGMALAPRDGMRRSPHDLQRDLEDRGVPKPLATAVRERVEAQLPWITDGGYDGLLTGVATACALQARDEASVRKTVSDLGEMQQLMADFSDELRKLDEALEVLAAYVVRMRTQTDATDQTLH